MFRVEYYISNFLVTGYDANGPHHLAVAAKAVAINRSPKQAFARARNAALQAYGKSLPTFYYNETGAWTRYRIFRNSQVIKEYDSWM